MSSVKTWLTKEDVMKDLPIVSGRGRRRVGHLDEGYLVIGNAPPPTMIEAEDDEMREQFGDAIHGRDIDYEHTPPDLDGIRDLLRMVQDPDGEDVCESINNTGQPSNCVIAISKASALNPNVKEFVPQGSLSSHSSSNVSETDPVVAEKTDEDVQKAKTDAKNKCDLNSNVIVNEKSVKLNVNQDLAAKLKNKISIPSKSDCFEVKKQRNVAIATLLRLNALDNKTESKPVPKEQTQVKLIKPEHYETRISPVKELEKAMPKSASTTPDPKSATSTAPSCSSNGVKSEPAPSTQAFKNSPTPKDDPTIKKSIEKVNQWFGETVEKKKIYLGPIVFTRKDPAACKSPSTSDSEQIQASKPKQKDRQYEPSDYADDLSKQFMERQSKAQKTQLKNTWEGLADVLKERDRLLQEKKRKTDAAEL